MNLTQDKRGVILVFTIILMAVLLSIAVGFSFFIISDINQAKAIDDSIIAYYAAETGIERTLYSVIKQDNFESMEQLKKDRANTEGLLPESQAVWNISSSTDYEKLFFRQRLYNGQGVKFYVLNRAENLNIDIPKSLLIDWTKGKDSEGNNSIINLQVSMTQLSPQSKNIEEDNSVLIYYTDTNEVELSDSLGPTCYNFKDSSLNEENANKKSDYVIELRALGGTFMDYIDKILVTVFNQDCSNYSNNKDDYLTSLNPRGISNLTIKSEGFFGKSKQLIIAHLPPRHLVSGLLSFVIFSEQSITKE